MDYFSVLNYQGSKKNLIEFIHESLDEKINKEDVILDVFSGTCSVGYSYKRTNTVYANDSEKYSSIIARALLCSNPLCIDVDCIKEDFYKRFSCLAEEQQSLINAEDALIKKLNVEELIDYYGNVPTFWNGGRSLENSRMIFTNFYSTTYFGVRQSVEIDLIRDLAECDTYKECKDFLLTSLFFAMKECVFSKDGHMAQPLNFTKNKSRLFSQRRKSIFCIFETKLLEFKNSLYTNNNSNKVFCEDFEDLLSDQDVQDNVTVIYADPPYTDMQYSRYYHLLNTVVKYEFAEPTKNGKFYTKGLYLDNRFQSQLSKKSTCLESMEKLIEFSKKHFKLLIISFAYPQNKKKQKTDRYVMDIDELINNCCTTFGADSVEIKKVQYSHSNNRNAEAKKVLEYLIICDGRR